MSKIITVLRREIRKAKKEYICDNCKKYIFSGDVYKYLYGGKEIYGKMIVLRFCKECIEGE